jgi:hypothetical protein
MDRHLHAAGQRGHVEREVGELGPAVPRPAVLPPCLLAGKLVAGREPHPEERAALRPGFRPPDQASLNLMLWAEGPVSCHEGVTETSVGSVEVEIYWDAQIAEQSSTVALFHPYYFFSNCS